MVSIVQVLFDGVAFGSIILLGAVGLSLLYGIGNFANFAHGELLTVSAYVTYLLYVTLGLPFLLAGAVTIGLTALLGVSIDRSILHIHRDSGSLTKLLVTVGIAFVLRSLIRMVWTSEPRSYRLGLERGIAVLDGGFPLGFTTFRFDLFVTRDSVLIVVLGLVCVAIVHLVLTRTKMGIAMRATAANRSLSQVTGIDTEQVTRLTWVLSAGLAAVGGVALAVTSGLLYPRMGFDVLLLVFAAVILGGIGSPYGAMIGAYVIGVAQEMSILLPGVGARYRLAVAFVILFVVMLVKPTGIAGGSWS
ncbi:branched-chain amino acid ABC transporter permease [Halogeometricum sp. CBA1124]|uniref:branched-chain amino acid ABC transporter permease n=1 Tax=Halogeometricum sp. CBA1124 TaxID=2668071 RepID=UPI00142B159C|nr:branched-chain amino acid ABC transporter permease [Halogeometricum sp. CBA1124]MUV56827.1 branched-chain amino acid ABC transporter permease [Halogeometricum sp. CBA1124]